MLTCVGANVPSLPWPADGVDEVLNSLKRYQFYRNGSLVQNSASASRTMGEADIGTNYTCAASFSASFTIPLPWPFDDQNVTVSVSTGISSARSITSAFLNLVSNPSITGTAQENSTLTCNNASYNKSTALSRSKQWTRNGSSIPGATGSAYTVTPADVGAALRCNETATRYGRSAGGISAPVTPTALPLTNSTKPAISGTAQAGQTLSCAAGTWTPAPASSALEWLRNGTVVGTGASYALTGADVGQAIACRENVSRLGQSNSATSDSVTPSAAPVTGGGGGDTGGGGTGGGDTGGTVVTPPAGKTLAQKRAAAIKKCKKKFKGKANAKKRAACIKKARRKFRA